MRVVASAVLLLASCGRAGFGLWQGTDGGGGAGDGDASVDDGAIDDSSGAGDDAASATGDAASDGPQTMMPTLFATFTNRNATTSPSARRSSGAAVASDGRIWTFGGFAGGLSPLADVAAYTPGTNAWEALSPTSPPAGRERHVVGWDGDQSVVVLFGGQGGFPTFTQFDQLFLLDPAAGSWAQVPKVGNWPAARKDAHLVWVPSLNQLLLYGGNNGSGTANRFADLWLLDVTSKTAATWAQINPVSGTPPAVSAACVVFDPAVRRLIVFGGETQDGVDANTTYQFLLDTSTWQQDSTTGTTPPGESFAQCAWDAGIGRLVIYGGQTNGGDPLGGDVFTYDPSLKVWEQHTLATGSAMPGNRADGGAVYSAALGGVVWFGGRTAQTTYSNETWLLDLAP